MSEKSIAIIGLPDAGKTTYLAALWHLLTKDSDSIRLRFDGLKDVKAEYLNSIMRDWRDGKTQKRSVNRKGPIVTIKLRDSSDSKFSLRFPDLSGETYMGMWEQRDFSKEIKDYFDVCSGMILFINANQTLDPPLVTDVRIQSEAFGETLPPNQYKAWDPKLASSQAKIVDLLQLLRAAPISVTFQKLSLVFSAWDKADPGRAPQEYFAEKMPLLHQYLNSKTDHWIWKTYGVSAQGGDYLTEGKTLSNKQKQELDRLLSLKNASERITVVDEEGTVNSDLTYPVEWLI